MLVRGSMAGASWSTTWALVPLIPNDETPARRGAAVLGQATFSVGTTNGVPRNETRGQGPEMQVAWDGFVLQAQDSLDQRCDASRGLQMTDVGLHRTDTQVDPSVRGSPKTARSRTRSDRRAPYRCRASRRRRCPPVRASRSGAPAGRGAAGRGRSARSVPSSDHLGSRQTRR